MTWGTDLPVECDVEVEFAWREQELLGAGRHRAATLPGRGVLQPPAGSHRLSQFPGTQLSQHTLKLGYFLQIKSLI